MLIHKIPYIYIQRISGNNNLNNGFLELLNSAKWYKNKETAESFKKPLLRLCSHYLFNVRKGNGLRAFDPVANFHLSNGAKIEHIQWLADISKKGIAQSAGIMVNYHYRLDKIEINHENYMHHGKIHASSDARSWLSWNYTTNWNKLGLPYFSTCSQGRIKEG